MLLHACIVRKRFRAGKILANLYKGMEREREATAKKDVKQRMQELLILFFCNVLHDLRQARIARRPLASGFYVIRPNHGPLKQRTKHGGDNSRSLRRNSFQVKCFSRIQIGRKIIHTQKFIAQLLSSPRSYSLPKSSTYTVVKSQFLGLQLSRQILSVQI
jgi:hypothetical protein